MTRDRAPALASGLHLAALGASLGALIGFGRAVGEIAAHDYLGLGFRRTIFLELRDTTTDVAGTGLLLALGVLAAWWLLRLLWPASRPFLRASFLHDLARQQELRWRVSTIILGLGWLIVTVSAYLDLRRAFASAVAISTVILLGMLWGSAFAARHVRESQPSFQAYLAAAYASAMFGLAGAYLQNRAYLNDPLNARNICGNLLLAAAVGLTFWSVRSQALGRRRPWPALVPIGLLGAAWLATPVLSTPSLRAGHPKSVILIGIDTLRLDDTSLIPGATRELTPNLRRLADGGISFNHAMAQAPWTMPSFASVITGRYPQEHGAYSLQGHLDEAALTLAELLREAGYRTSGAVAHRYVSSRHGFAQGFATYNEDNSVGHVGVTSPQVTDLGLDFLRGSTREPFFLFLHYFDPHYQFQDHPDWDWADAYRGWLRGPQNDIGNLRAKRHLLEASDVQFLRDLYHEEIAATDREIGRLLDAIHALGLDDEVAVVVVADHGEEFMERGWLGHTISMHEEVIRVPLVMRAPGLAVGSRIDRPIETRQIFSTILDYLRIQGQRGLRKESLLPLLDVDAERPATYRGPSALFSTSLLSDAPLDSGKRVRLFAMREGRWKLILDLARGLELLYDLEQDPLETTNLAAVETQQMASMRPRLQDWIQEMAAQRGTAAELELGEDEIEQLKALGYL